MGNSKNNILQNNISPQQFNSPNSRTTQKLVSTEYGSPINQINKYFPIENQIQQSPNSNIVDNVTTRQNFPGKYPQSQLQQTIMIGQPQFIQQNQID
jgi:hypothetical protein